MKKIGLTVISIALMCAMSGCGNTSVQNSNTTEEVETTSSEENELQPGQVAVQSVEDNKDMSQTYSVREVWVYNNGQTIYGEAYVPDKEGKFPLVIFSHELGNSHTSGIPYAKKLAENGFAVFTFDFRGGSVEKNQSDGDSTNMSVMTEATDLETVMAEAKTWDFVDSDKIILMGGSQGGMVTAVVAARNPDIPKAVILLYPALSIVDDAHNQFASEDDIPHTYDLFGGWMTVGRNYAEDIWDYDTYGTIGKYKGPVLILHGDNDTTVNVSYSDRASEVYENAEYHVIEGAGHGFSGSDFNKAVEYILSFVKKNISDDTIATDSISNTEETVDDSSNETAVTITIDGTEYAAHLYNNSLTEELKTMLPLTLKYRTYASGFDEKIGDLKEGLDVSVGDFDNDPDAGDIGYWEPQPRIVLYYGDVGAYDGIHIIGHFDDHDKADAITALQSQEDDFEVTLSLNEE